MKYNYEKKLRIREQGEGERGIFKDWSKMSPKQYKAY